MNKYGSCHLRGWRCRKGESHAHHKEVSQVARLPGKDILLSSVQYPFCLLCKPYHSFPLRNHLFLLMWKCPTTPSFIHPHHLQERVWLRLGHLGSLLETCFFPTGVAYSKDEVKFRVAREYVIKRACLRGEPRGKGKRSGEKRVWETESWWHIWSSWIPPDFETYIPS